MNANTSKIYKNLCNVAKSVVKRKLLILNAYIQIVERFKSQ